MKNLKLIALLFLIAGVVKAQTSDNPWLITAGINGVGLQNDFGSPLSDNVLYGKSDFNSLSVGVPSLSVFRSIYGGLSLGAGFSSNNLQNETGGSDAEFYNIDAALKYGFARDSKLSPYLKAGWGFSSFDAISNSEYDASKSLTVTYFGSAGLNLKLGDKWGLFLETSYRATQDRPDVNYLQHTVGVSFGLGSGDADKDGISDKKDKCPDVPGLKEFEGCPDTDEDGIPDNLDGCPEEAGPEENNGCPDTDGDGVLDKDDACVDVVGLVELNGCPDTDADGIIDSEDECPVEAGDAENKGCPWPDTDSDGVADKDDACPEEAGTAEGNGCPDTPKDILDKMNGIGSNIMFAAESSKLMGKKVLAAVGEIKRVLDENPNAKIIIEGHASTDGSTQYNDALSLRRAESVKAKLIELGADSSRIEVKSFGESMPIDGDDSLQARAKNRRVEFKSMLLN